MNNLQFLQHFAAQVETWESELPADIAALKTEAALRTMSDEQFECIRAFARMMSSDLGLAFAGCRFDHLMTKLCEIEKERLGNGKPN